MKNLTLEQIAQHLEDCAQMNKIAGDPIRVAEHLRKAAVEVLLTIQALEDFEGTIKNRQS